MTSPEKVGKGGEYRNFRIDLSSRGEGLFRAKVLESPAAEGTAEFRLASEGEALDERTVAFDAARWRNFVLGMDGQGDPASEAPEMVVRRLGRELYDALFGGTPGRLWERCLGVGERPEAPLRLVLEMDLDDEDTARLHALPWECLRPPGERLPLLQEPDFSLVRYLSQSRRPARPPRPRRLRVLAVTGDVVSPELARLDLRRELDALSASGVDLKVVSDLLGDARDDLVEFDPHVLHFLGHGGFRSGEGGVLYLCDADGAPRPLRPEALARCLRPCRSLRLVFLNACATARACHSAPFAGVATALVRTAGIPAVIAMQRPISDAGAARFAARVYQHLGTGDALDRAVYEGRCCLDGTEWSTPVLFSRLQDGRLFAEHTGRSGRRRWVRWVAALTLATAASIAGLMQEPVWQNGEPTDGRSRQVIHPTSQAAAVVPDAMPGGGSEGGTEPAVERLKPALYRLGDGEDVYMSELGRYLSASFRQKGEFIFSTLDLSGSDVSRAVGRPRRVDFPLGDGETVSVDVVSIDDRTRSLTVMPSPGEPRGSAG